MICLFVRRQCTPVSWIGRSRDVRTFVAGYQCTADNQFLFQNWPCFSLTSFPFDGKSSALNSTVLIYEYIPTCCFKYTSPSVLSVYNNKVKCCYLVLLYTVCDNLSRTEPNFFFIHWSLPQVSAKFRQEEPNYSVNTWVRPVSNVVLLPCQTHLIELNLTLAQQ